MIIVSESSYSAFGDKNVDDFVFRCTNFLKRRGYLKGQDSLSASEYVRKRIPRIQEIGLSSERAITFAIAIQEQSNRDLQDDQNLIEGMARLPDEESVRIEWLKTYLERSPEWQT